MKKIVVLFAVFAVLCSGMATGLEAGQRQGYKGFLKLVENTDQCLGDCHAVIEVTNPLNFPLRLGERGWRTWVEKAPGARNLRRGLEFEVLAEEEYDVEVPVVGEVEKSLTCPSGDFTSTVTDSGMNGSCTSEEWTVAYTDSYESDGIVSVPSKVREVVGSRTEVRTREVYGQFTPEDRVLLPGETVRIRISGKKQPVLGGNDVDWKLGFMGYEPPWAWWSSNWLKRKEVTLTNNQGSTLTDFPMYVEVPRAAEMQSDYDDIRFVDGPCETGTEELDFEVVDYDGVTAHVYVSIPSLTPGANTVCMYYGNDAASSGEDADGTWNTNYRAVYHMTDASDSSGYGKDGANHGTTSNADCMVGDCRYFGGDDWVTLSSDILLSGYPVSVCMWVNPHSYTDDGTRFIDLTSDYKVVSAWVKDNDEGVFWVGDGSGAHMAYTGSYNVPKDEWTLFCGTVNSAGNTVRSYYNDQAGGTASTSGVDLPDQPRNNYLGTGCWGIETPFKRFYIGYMDEVMVAEAEFSADWIKQMYEMVVSQDVLVSFGGGEDPSLPEQTSFLAEPDNALQGTQVDVSANVVKGDFDLDRWWFTYDGTFGGVTPAAEGTNSLQWDTTGLLGGYTLFGYVNDSAGNTHTSDGVYATVYTTTTVTTSSTTTTTDPGGPSGGGDSVIRSKANGLQLVPADGRLTLEVSGFTMRRPDGELVCCGPDNTNAWVCTDGAC